MHILIMSSMVSEEGKVVTKSMVNDKLEMKCVSGELLSWSAVGCFSNGITHLEWFFPFFLFIKKRKDIQYP